MHYYKRNLGDIAKKTAHLSPLEFGIYNLILDGYYAREQAPTLLDATRWARARTAEEKEAVLGVLDEFFALGKDGLYRQSRVDEEVAIYHGKAETNRAIAVEREAKKRARKEHESCTTGEREDNGSSDSGEPNHKPLTTNHNNSPIPPAGGNEPAKKKDRSAFSLKTYLAECKAEGVKPIPDDDSVFDYASQAGISSEVLALHWAEFRARYSVDGAKKYKAWRVVFGKSVRGNWFRLWYFGPNGECNLTTAGIQAKNIADASGRKAA